MPNPQFTAHGQYEHLLTEGRSPPCARATGTLCQPLEPVGINAAGLYATAPGVEVSFDDDAGADHVAYRAGEFLDRCESIHRGKDAAGVFRGQSADVLPWLAQRYLYQPGFNLTHP